MNLYTCNLWKCVRDYIITIHVKHKLVVMHSLCHASRWIIRLHHQLNTESIDIDCVWGWVSSEECVFNKSVSLWQIDNLLIVGWRWSCQSVGTSLSLAVAWFLGHRAVVFRHAAAVFRHIALILIQRFIGRAFGSFCSHLSELFSTVKDLPNHLDLLCPLIFAILAALSPGLSLFLSLKSLLSLLFLSFLFGIFDLFSLSFLLIC